ncbi:MAG: hypothetical protein JWM98_3399 [Thermoleophilia bacterium]|nr:hypothetical protein [Thermoleophilia bacterium]
MARNDSSSRTSGWGRRLAVLAVGAAFVGASIGSSSAPAATSSVVVSADIPSAISLTNNCDGAPATKFGTVLPGAAATTATGAGRCNVTWTSSNDSSMLRIAQRDGTGTAMSKPTTLGGSVGWGMFRAVDTADGTNLLGVGSGGTFSRSSNGGAAWTTVGGIGGNGSEISDLEQVPGTPATAWIVGYGMRVQQVTGSFTAPVATDRTGNLLAQGWPASETPLAVAVVDASNVFIGGSGGWFARTANGGTNWTVYQQPSVNAVVSLTISPTGHVWATTAGNPIGNVWRTPVGSGATAGSWTRYPVAAGGSITGAAVPDATHGYAVGSSGVAFSWDGASWTPRINQSVEPHDLQGVASSPSTPGSAVAVGIDGIVLQTIDSGVSWTRRASKVGDAFYDVADSAAGYVAVGAARTTTSSPDGVTWTYQYDEAVSRTRFGTAAQPVDGRIALQVGSRGSIWRSTDTGATWTLVPSGTNEPLFDVAFASQTLAWAVGETGTILKSTDAGATWSAVPSGTTQRLRGVSAGAPDQVVAVGDAGTVVRSGNGGTSWSVATVLGGEQLNDVSMGSRLVGVVVGVDAIRRTVDGGVTWIAPTSVPAASWHGSVSMVSDQVGFTGDDWASVWRTTDGGATWTDVYVANGFITAVSAATTTVVYTFVDQTLYRSVDAGLTWASAASVPEWPSSMAAEDATTVVIGGEFGGFHSMTASSALADRIPDYGAAPNAWAPSAEAMFGVCVQSVGAQTSVAAPWAADGGTCTAVDTDPWRAIPTAATKVAFVPVAGNSGSVDLVWGVRFAATQAPGSYSAGVVFEALAPDA